MDLAANSTLSLGYSHNHATTSFSTHDQAAPVGAGDMTLALVECIDEPSYYRMQGQATAPQLRICRVVCNNVVVAWSAGLLRELAVRVAACRCIECRLCIMVTAFMPMRVLMNMPVFVPMRMLMNMPVFVSMR